MNIGIKWPIEHSIKVFIDRILFRMVPWLGQESATQHRNDGEWNNSRDKDCEGNHYRKLSKEQANRPCHKEEGDKYSN